LPDAVRGVYIAPTFPGGEPNFNGWADWSGTSFATPVISALGRNCQLPATLFPVFVAKLDDVPFSDSKELN
jgi:hypothetical protein